MVTVTDVFKLLFLWRYYKKQETECFFVVFISKGWSFGIKCLLLHPRIQLALQQVAVEIESQVRGWYNYYNKFGKTEFVKVMNHLNMVLAYWVRSLFYHWQRGQPRRLCLCTKRWVWRAVWGETFTHGSERGWGWNSLALLDPDPQMYSNMR